VDDDYSGYISRMMRTHNETAGTPDAFSEEFNFNACKKIGVQSPFARHSLSFSLSLGIPRGVFYMLVSKF
jgi:hypothetical protein